MSNCLFCSRMSHFLEDLNITLNAGDIPALLDNEEKVEIIEKVIFSFLQFFRWCAIILCVACSLHDCDFLHIVPHLQKHHSFPTNKA